MREDPPDDRALANRGEHATRTTAGTEENLPGKDRQQEVSPVETRTATANLIGLRRLRDHAGAPRVIRREDAVISSQVDAWLHDEPAQPHQQGARREDHLGRPVRTRSRKAVDELAARPQREAALREWASGCISKQIIVLAR